MKIRHFTTARLAAALVTLAAFSVAWGPQLVEAQEAAVSETIAAFKKQDPSLGKLFDESAGYAVFPKVGEVAFIIGAEHGKGELIEGGKAVGVAKLTAVSVGASLGGQTFQEVIFFKSKEALDKFKGGKFSLGAESSAVVLKQGSTGASAIWRDDVAVFVQNPKGVMLELSVNGQRFKFEPN